MLIIYSVVLKVDDLNDANSADLRIRVAVDFLALLLVYDYKSELIPPSEGLNELEAQWFFYLYSPGAGKFCAIKLLSFEKANRFSVLPKA